MEDVKLRLAGEIAEKLSAAPDSAAKAELIEELSDNLYSRYLEMTEIGVEPDYAFRGAMDALGDTDELVDYLNSLAPDEPLPGPEDVQPQGGAAAGDLDALLKSVEEIMKSAVGQAKSAIQDMKDRMEQEGGFSYTSPNGHVHVNINPGAGKPPKAPKAPKAPQAPGAPADQEELEAILRAEEETLRADLAADGVTGEEAEKIIADTMESARAAMEKNMADGDPIHAENAWVERQPDDTYAVQGKIRSIDVEVGGDIAVRMDETPDDDVVIGGDIEDITVDVSAAGKLTIRQRARTASAGFFFKRGLSAADVELTLPRRHWDSIRVSTVNGDIEMESDEPVGVITVQTVSGDVNGCVDRCEKLTVNAVNGDVEWHGDARRAELNLVSGDVNLEGHFGSLEASSISGDVEFSGDCGADHVKCSSMSGDIQLESDVLPRSMELSSKSGDIQVRIPDAGPFSVQCKTTSGEISSDFFEGVISTHRFSFSYGPDSSLEGAPVYRLSTVSGDITLDQI